MDHLRYSGLPFETQRAAFLDIVSDNELIVKRWPGHKAFPCRTG
jgi:hypothetical protein